ncbi:unnamed protein product [Amoebophrya sp. A25]|nr:unnamed protein product [Amoebophrya sp. A25]|eukprot:GSA25T00020799001.1
MTAGTSSKVSEQLSSRLNVAEQQHLLDYAEQLSPRSLTSLEGQLEDMDFSRLNSLFQIATKKHFGKALAVRGGGDGAAKDAPEVTTTTTESSSDTTTLEPPSAVQTLDSLDADSIALFETKGGECIARGEVAALCLGGGAGTRLGLDGPKGLFSPPGLPSGKSLFQLFAERLLCLKKRFQAKRLPFLIMTSPLNHDTTVEFFRKNAFFGLDEADCHFFPQGTLPAYDYEGRIILETKASVALSPDGNGGVYPALEKSGLLKKCEEMGVKYFHVFGVDNILVRPADPRFLGYCVAKDAEVGNKSVWKCDPEEKVGVVAMRGGKYCVVEYSEIGEKEKNARTSDGKLSFGAGNIVNHVFRLDFLKETVLPNLENSYHVAEKKIPYADPEAPNASIKPSSNNGIKLETFIFDVFPLTERMAVFECKREEEFAPIKNASGTDSPDSALKMISELHASWVKAAGGVVEADTVVEVSPLVSYAGEGLEDLVKGKTFAGGKVEIK